MYVSYVYGMISIIIIVYGYYICQADWEHTREQATQNRPWEKEALLKCIPATSKDWLYASFTPCLENATVLNESYGQMEWRRLEV